MKFNVCMLFYGEHVDLARRLLSSVLRPEWAEDFVDLRIGLNQVCDETWQLVHDALQAWPGGTLVFKSDENLGKYPLMRRMFHDVPLSQSLSLWWDDDSFLLDAPENWPELVRSKLHDYHMVGSIWNWRLSPNEIAFLDRKPWVPPNARPTPRPLPFITGGWWGIRTEILQRHDWPPPDMQHNGGDVSLGHLCWKNEYRLGMFKHGLGINSDNTGRDSSAKRRGLNQYPYFHPQAGQPDLRKRR